MTVPWLQPEQYEAVLGALALLVILAMLLERALAVIFEWSVLRDWLKEKRLRVPIALVASYVICVWGEFDVFSVVFAKAGGIPGILVGTFATAAVIAGGSKGAILLFQGVLGFGREAVKARIAAKSSTSAKADE